MFIIYVSSIFILCTLLNPNTDVFCFSFSQFSTQQLWKLAVDQAELPTQLRLIKDMFLLGRGELFLEFIVQAESILDRTPSSNFSRGKHSC